MLTSIINACNTIDGILKQGNYNTVFGVVYSDLKVSDVEGYDLLIVEPYFFDREKVQEIQNKGTKLIAYISLGEVNESRDYFETFKSVGFRGINKNHGSYYIDLSSKKVHDVFLTQVISSYMELGFDGLFLDTIDAVSPYSERKDQQANMINLIHSIRESIPNKVIIQNAGFFLLPDTKDYIDAVAIENVATGFNFQLDQYIIYDDSFIEERIALVDSLSTTNNIPFYIIDFAEDKESELFIRNKLKDLNYPLFISNIGFEGLPNQKESYIERED